MPSPVGCEGVDVGAGVSVVVGVGVPGGGVPVAVAVGAGVAVDVGVVVGDGVPVGAGVAVGSGVAVGNGVVVGVGSEPSATYTEPSPQVDGSVAAKLFHMPLQKSSWHGGGGACDDKSRTLVVHSAPTTWKSISIRVPEPVTPPPGNGMVFASNITLTESTSGSLAITVVPSGSKSPFLISV